MIYFFFGPDSYSLSLALGKMKSGYGIVEEPAVEQKEALWEALQSQGLFAEKKLVVLRGFLDEASELPASTADIVFVELDPDRRTRGFKHLLKHAEVREFVPPTGAALTQWIKDRVSESGARIEPEAVNELVGRLGEVEDLRQYISELEKLTLYRREATISRGDVAALVGRSLPDNVFELTNLFAEGRGREAAFVLQRMLGRGVGAELQKQAIQIVGALASQVRSLLLVKAVAGQAPEAAAKKLGWKEGRVWVNRKLAGKFDDKKLRSMLVDLQAIDRRLKTSEESPRLLLALFLQKAKV